MFETRYVNPVAACYRILTKPLQCKSHSIIRLAVHLPQQQSIIIHDIDDDVSVGAALHRSSTLLAYFDLNKQDISDSDSSSNIAVQSKEGQFLRRTDVFIWDEAPMAPRYALEIMDRTLKDIMSNDLLFGGKIVILSGDFRQLLPILPRSIRSDVIKGTTHYNSEKDTLPGIPKNFRRCSGMQNDDLSRYFQLPPPLSSPHRLKN